MMIDERKGRQQTKWEGKVGYQNEGQRNDLLVLPCPQLRVVQKGGVVALVKLRLLLHHIVLEPEPGKKGCLNKK